MVKVYMQDKKGIACDLVATFEDENLYDACRSQIEASAREHRLIVTESIE